MLRLPRSFLLLLILAFANPLCAQEPARQILRLVPDDYGLVLVAHDLRDQFARWDKSSWLKKVHASPLAQALLNSQELKDLLKLRDDLEKHLGLEWPALRDDVFGDAAAFAFRPGPADKGDPEDFLILVQARKPEVLNTLLDRVNALQKKSGELKELEARTHRGNAYFRRVHDRSTQFYFVRAGLLVLAGREATLQSVIEQTPAEKTSNYWQRSFDHGAAPRSFFSLLVNARAFDGEFRPGAGKGAEALFKERLAAIWSALDGMVLNVAWEESIELRLALLGREKEPAPLAKDLFAPARPHPLWNHFPDQAIFTLTGKVDFSFSRESWEGLLPPEARRFYLEILQKSLAAVIGIDLEKDLLPNIGPEWGVCVFAAQDPKHVPQAVFALALKPGPKDVQADQAVYKGLHLLAGLAIFDYNLKHRDHIRLRTLHQDKVEVKTLTNDKLFPAGFQPSFALKDGYLLLASSPEAILRFQKNPDAVSPKDENLVFRLSATELAKELRLRREFLSGHIAKSNGMPAAAAQQILDALLSGLDLFDQVELAHTSGPAQMNLILRIRP